MKQPKFRVWDPVSHQMEYFSIGTTMLVEDLDIMMGSGKLDKQGKEIYEGDIIYFKQEEVSERGEFDDERIIEQKCKVVYEDGALLLELSPYVKEYLRDYNISHWTVKEFKIIGNIYNLPKD